MSRVVTASTYANVHNLAPSFVNMLKAKYEGTTLGQQEIHAAILDEAKGALWNMALLERNRVNKEPAKDFWRLTAIGVDPATANPTLKRDQTGIVAMSKGADGHGYVRRDASGHYLPADWARHAVAMYRELDADFIVAEGNQGGEMVRHTLHTIDKNVVVKIVDARQGKQARAEPVSMLYEQGMIHHIGYFPALEDQMVTWEPHTGDASPDRIDAMVWAARHLMITAPIIQGFAGPVMIHG